MMEYTAEFRGRVPESERGDRKTSGILIVERVRYGEANHRH